MELATKSYNNNEVPVGAIIVDYKEDKIIAESSNNMLKNSDPTAHAEIDAIRQACKIKKSQRLPDCDIYVSLEPCPMCASAISFARIRRLYFGAYDPKSGGVEHGPKIFESSSCHSKPEIYGGINEKEFTVLIQKFFREKREI